MGVLTYVVAFLVAAVLGTVKAATHRKVQYWLRFDPTAVRVAEVPVALLHGCTGLLAVVVAHAADWEVAGQGADRGVVNGLLYGFAAAAILRLEITSFGLQPFSPARVLLRYGLELSEAWIDAKAARGVARRVGDLRLPVLCRVSWRLFLRHVEPRCADELAAYSAALYLRTVQVRALEGRETGSPADEVDAIEAWERLRYYCEALITKFCDATIDLEEHSLVESTRLSAADRDDFDGDLHGVPPPDPST